jgi:serine/threonine protein kinase
MNEPQKIGRYEIISEKGRGAMGAVYIARDPAMDRIVALKTIHSGALTGPLAQEYRDRFFRETHSAGALTHPGIVTVFDAGEQDGVPYLVMEFIEGHNLAEAAKTGQRFTFERVCEIGQQIAEALAYAHTNGVIHRDIKPANILMTSKEKYGIERPKITDFGIAKIGAAQITTAGQVLGTPAFMAPEQFTGAPIDGRTDLFSLGVILYWMATGEYAFPGETLTAVSYKVVHTEPVPPQKLNPAVPSAFDQIILRCLTKSPADRYATGEDLARELVALRAGRSTAEVQSAVPFSPAAASNTSMDVTLDTPLPIPGPEQNIRQSAGNTKPPHPANKSPLYRALITLGVLTAAILLLGGWYGYTHREKIDSILNPDSAPETVDEPATTSEPASSSPAANTRRRKEAPSLPKPAKSAPKSPDLAKNSIAALPTPPRVDFDPKKLDPDANAKLNIEADHFPPNVPFTVEMNGKIYFERGPANAQDAFEDLYVPPSVTEFRVIAGEGSNRKTSNIVSAEFKAKKKKTLRIELRTQGQKSNAGMPAGVYPDSQIVVALK